MFGGMVFHKQAKRANLHRTCVVGSEPMNRKKTLNEVKSDKDIIEVKWFGKHHVTY
jgi:hypothetical protein